MGEENPGSNDSSNTPAQRNTGELGAPDPNPDTENASPTLPRPSDAASSSVAGKIAKASLAITGIIFLCKILGAAEKFLLGALYAQDRFQIDIFLALAVLAVLFYDIMRYAIIPALLPTLVKVDQHEGEAHALALASSFANGLLLAALPLLALSLLYPEGLIKLFVHKDVLSPGAAAEVVAKAGEKYARELELGKSILRIMTPAGLLLVWGGVLYCVLHSRKRFAISAFGDFAYKLLGLLPLVAMLLLANVGGQREWVLKNGVYLIALGVSAGAFGLFGIQSLALMKSWKHYRFQLDFKNSAFKDVLRTAAWPLLYAVLFIGARRILDIYFGFGFGYAYHDRGFYTGLELSYRLVEFPFRFLVEPLAYAIFPFLVAQREAGDFKGFSETLDGGLRSAVLVLAPMSILLFLLRVPVAGIIQPKNPELAAGVMQHGHQLMDLISWPLAFYSLGILGFGLELLLTRAVFALGDQRSPALLEVLALAIYLTVVLSFRGSSLMHASVALAFVTSRSTKAVAMFFVLSRRSTTFDLEAWGRFAFRIVVASVATGVITWLVAKGAAGIKEGRIGFILQLGAGGVAGSVVYLASIWLMQVPELNDLLKLIRKKKSTPQPT